ENSFSKGRAYILGMIVIALLSVKTFFQSQIWKNPLALWNYTIQQNPNSFFAYNNRGNVYNAQGRYDLAIVDYTKALALNPRYAIGYNNRGVLFDAIGQDDRALDDFNQVVRLDPAFPEAYYNRSLILARRKNYALALQQARKYQQLGGILPEDY